MTKLFALGASLLAIVACGPTKPTTAVVPACPPDRRAADVTNGSPFAIDVYLMANERETFLTSISAGGHQEFDVPDQGWLSTRYPRQSVNIGPRATDSQQVRTRYFCR